MARQRCDMTADERMMEWFFMPFIVLVICPIIGVTLLRMWIAGDFNSAVKEGE